MAKLRSTLITIVVLVLVGSNLMLLERIEQLKSSTATYLSAIELEVRSVQTRMDSFIHEVNQAQKLVPEHDYRIQNVGESYQQADVDVDVRFRELPKDAAVYLLYEDYQQAAGKWIRAELQPNTSDDSALEYCANLQLAYDGNYNLRAVIETPQKTLAEDLSAIRLSEQLANRLNMQAQPKSATGNRVTYSVVVSNYHRDVENLKLKSLMCYVYYSDELVEAIDIMQEPAKENYGPVDLERWWYNGSIKTKSTGGNSVEPFSLIAFKIVAKDGLGREYEHTYNQVP